MHRTLSLYAATILLCAACDSEPEVRSLDDIASCKTYFDAFRECHGADNVAVTGIVNGFQKQLDRGTSPSIIGKACENANSNFTCRKRKSKSAPAAPAESEPETTQPSSDEASEDDGGGAVIPTRKGTAGAYELDGSVIAIRSCKKRGRSWDIVGCGKRVRASAKTRICAKRGKGTHEYRYRSGLGKITTNKVFCR